MQKPILYFTLSTLVILLALAITWPILPHILPHADEYLFYTNAWSILSGKELQNYFHVAATEYAFTAFLSVVNMLTKSGINFPNGDPDVVTYYYGRIFGLILYLITYLAAVVVLQRGENKFKLRTLFFTLLYFGSLGIFERAFRVNSDETSVLVILNFLIVSLYLHKKRSQPFKFFLVNLGFGFLATFTNFKSIYLATPILVLNTLLPFIFYDNEKENHESFYTKLYKMALYTLGVFGGTVALWAIFIPKPFNYFNFWMSLRNTIVTQSNFDFNFPNQTNGNLGSWSSYFYDFFVEYIGLTQLAAILTVVGTAYYLGRKRYLSFIFDFLRKQLKFQNFKTGELFLSTELIILASAFCYYLGIGHATTHWSRWGLPVGFFGLIILGTVLEKSFLFITNERASWPRRPKFWLAVLLLFTFGWSLRFALAYDISRSNYPSQGGLKLTSADVKQFLTDKGVAPSDYTKTAAWYGFGSEGIGNILLSQLTDPEHKETKYLFWPYWNIGVLYENGMDDKESANQMYLVKKYAQKVDFRFPTLLSHYIHYTKMFAWRYLGITWYPEVESLVESQYGVVELKSLPNRIMLDYDVPFDKMTYYYTPYSEIFNLKNLPNGYMFPPCYSNPFVVYAQDGKPVPENPVLGGSGKTAGLYCHGTRFVMTFKGNYWIKIEGLPKGDENGAMIYSAYNYTYDPITKTIYFHNPSDAYSAEFGVATREKNVPGLKFHVSYDSLVNSN
ncbi:MAG: hypothetical protein M1352_03080 [Patescibacteria group bacterium]|nr:hypothetical protein [Patescibacteria group bacterium]